MSVLQKVGKEEVQGSGAAQACSQGMEEQVAVKQLLQQMSITLLKYNAMLTTRGPDWDLALPLFGPSIHKRT